MFLKTQTTRLLGAAWLVIGLAACDGPPTLTPTPTPTPTLTRTPPVTVSGTVLGFRATGDAHGRFTINDNSAFILFFQTDPESEYRFPCDWCPIVTSSPWRELPVVHTTWSGNRPPPGWFGVEAGAWGTVSELIDGSLQPVAGATVTLDRGIPDPPATTSPNGFYWICSVVGADQPRTVTALKTGYNPGTRDFFSYGDGVNLQLTRK